MPFPRRALAVLCAAAVAVVATPALSSAAVNPYERGPAPTVASLEAATGPFAIESVTVARAEVSGFGGGTVYHPTDTSAGSFGAVAIVPGFSASQSGVAWLGPRLASQGFVVFTIDTTGSYDQADSRGAQLLAALDYLTTSSAVRTQIDPDRLAVAGHSMGGGGALVAARTRPSLRAALPLAPWHGTKTWPEVRAATLIVGADNDLIAPVGSNAEAFYVGLTGAPEKAYLELDDAGHWAPTANQNPLVAKYSVAWLKRFLDEDTRYERFLCPAPAGPGIQEYRDTCPHV
ncbi:alpha/beta hydrolase family protein [Actinoplanes subglobosus]|uniref:Alpha/beta hydrolase family protein n=1 Tax=Actinoplanes subglobosus TaxID=1547892 RepID=A0ABV8IYR8_9ACTN